MVREVRNAERVQLNLNNPSTQVSTSGGNSGALIVNQEMLDYFKLTVEEWNKLSPEKQAELVTKFKQDKPITGMELERTEGEKWEPELKTGTTFTQALSKFYPEYANASPERKQELEDRYFNEYILGKNITLRQLDLYAKRATSAEEYQKVSSMIVRLKGKNDAETTRIQNSAYDKTVVNANGIDRQQAGYTGTTSVIADCCESLQDRMISDVNQPYATQQARINIVSQTHELFNPNGAVEAIANTGDQEAISAFGTYNTVNKIGEIHGTDVANSVYGILLTNENIEGETREGVVDLTIRGANGDLRKEELSCIAFNSGNVNAIVGAQRGAQSIEDNEVFNRVDTRAVQAVDALESEEDRRYATQSRMDVMATADADRQKMMYSNTMQSTRDDVLETAASNIHKLDESVRGYAEEVTKSLGKENVTNAIQKDAPTSVNNKTKQTKTAEVKENSVTLTAGKKDYKLDLNTVEGINKFIEVSQKHPYEVARYLSNLKGVDLESKLEVLCKHAPNQVLGLVKSNTKLGVQVLTCPKVDLTMQNKVANYLISKCPETSDEHKLALEHLGKYYNLDKNNKS